MASILKVYCSDPALLERLDADVRKTDCPSRSKYVVSLLDFTLTPSRVPPSMSCLKGLTRDREVHDSLPKQYIEALAHSQNRDFVQMLRHMLEISMTHYPLDAFPNPIAQEEGSLQTATLPWDSSTYPRWSGNLS